MNLKQYFLDIYSAEFCRDKQKDFFLVQMLMTIACSLLNSLWVIKDVFVKGIGPNGNLYFVVVSRLVPTILLIPFIIWSLLNKKVEPFLANILLYINIFMPIFAIHFSVVFFPLSSEFPLIARMNIITITETNFIAHSTINTKRNDTLKA